MLFVLLKWEKGFLQVSYFLHCAVSSCQVQYPSSLWAQKPYQVENRFIGFFTIQMYVFLADTKDCSAMRVANSQSGFIFNLRRIFFALRKTFCQNSPRYPRFVFVRMHVCLFHYRMILCRTNRARLPLLKCRSPLEAGLDAAQLIWNKK